VRRKVHLERGPDFDNIETIKQAVEIGAGIALLPEPTVERERAAGTLATVTIEGEALMRPLGILHRRQGELPAAAKEFIDMLTSPEGMQPEAIDTAPFTENGMKSGNGVASARR
jgi:DNA-binding transcriptional LysR family regulator